MSGMFDNYENLADDYVPNNLRPSHPPKKPCSDNLDPCRPNKPYEDYDAKNNLVGYWWYYGNTFNLEFNIEQEATIVDSQHYIPAEEFMKGMKPDAIIKLYDFRRECIFTYVVPKVEITKVILPIDEKLSNKLVQGIYYCSLTLVNEEKGYNETIFKLDDCTLTVK